MARQQKQKSFCGLMKKGVQDPVALNNLICGHTKEENPDSAFENLCKIMEKGGITSCKDLIKSLNEEGNTKQADVLSMMILGKGMQIDGKKGKKKATIAC